MRCSLLAFGFANTRGQEDRWHANYGGPARTDGCECGNGKKGDMRKENTHDLVTAFSVERSQGVVALREVLQKVRVSEKNSRRVYTGARVQADVHQGTHNHNLTKNRRARGMQHSVLREHACPAMVLRDWADYMLVAKCTTTVIAQARLLSVLWVFQPVMLYEMATVCVAFLWRTSSKDATPGCPRVKVESGERSERRVNPNHKLHCPPHSDSLHTYCNSPPRQPVIRSYELSAIDLG